MPIAGMAAGANDTLQAILQQAFIRQQQEQEAARLADAQRLREREFNANEEYRAGQVARQTRLDDIALADRRQDQNKAGVQRMMGEYLMQRGSTPLDQGARNQLMGMGLSEGVQLPEAVLTDPGQAQRDRIALEELRNKNELQQIAAQGAQQRQTATARTAPSGPSPYAAERSARTLQSVDELIGQVNDWTAGAGSLLANVPATDARSLKAQLDTLKANIAFNELTEMREASKTGGALGSVAVRELALLESTLGALDQGMKPADLIAQLNKVKQNIARWQAAKGGTQMAPSHGPAPTATQATTEAPVQKWGRDAQGRPVRMP